MITRRKAIKVNAAEVSVTVSFSTADLRNSLKKLYKTLEDSVSKNFALTVPHSEQDLTYYFSRETFPLIKKEEIRRQLCRWAIVQSENNNLIYRGADPNEFFLSPSLAKKLGRPPKDDKNEI